MRFLIDECLTPQLALMAQGKGYEASHVVWLGLQGTKDWDLIPIIVDNDWTFVTRNSVDFRGNADMPGKPGLHATVAIHAGLVCLNGVEGMNLDDQEEMFHVALDWIADHPDLVNRVLDITDDGTDDFDIQWYELPAA